AAEDRGAGGADAMRDFQDLLLGLDGAGPGHDDDLVPADARAVRQLDYGRLRTPLSGDLLVRLRDVDDLEDAGQPLEAGALDFSVVADESDGGALLPRDGARLVAEVLDRVDDALDVLLRRVVSHHDEHRGLYLREKTGFRGWSVKGTI